MNYVAYIRPAGSKATLQQAKYNMQIDDVAYNLTHVGLTRTSERSDTYCHFEHQNCWVMGTQGILGFCLIAYHT